MRRLYYLFKNVNAAKPISDDLHQIGIDDEHLHFMSRESDKLADMHVHSASVVDETGSGRTSIVGLAVGVVSMLLMAHFSLAHVYGGVLPVMGYLIAAVAGGTLGWWFGAFIGMFKKNHHLEGVFDKDHDDGTLLMIDVFDDEEESRATQMMNARHAEATLSRVDKNYH